MEVSRFSCMKFLSVRGVCDYAGPGSDSRYRRCRCCLPQPLSESAFPNLKLFGAQYPAHRCRCLRFTCRLATARAKLAVRMDSLSPFLLHAGLSRRTGGPLSGHDSPPLRLTTGLMSPASAARQLTKPKARGSQLRAN